MSEAFVGMMVTPSVKLVRPLGEGGMGAVWVADHLALRTQVVVKFIAHGLKSNKEAQDRFSREAAAASQVKSPHVVQTFDHGITDQGIPYIVMELLDGRDLSEYLEREGRVAPDLVLEIIGQLARALDRAHEKGIIHRDIKPGNIYLCDVGGGGGEVFVKLLDFGIAKGVDLLGTSTGGVDSGTKTGSMVGSPFYMSPEQILGSKDIGHRSDLWSVGVVTFEMLTGKKPFDAETMGGLAIKIHSGPLPLPSDANDQLPRGVDAWFARACSRDVAQRFDSAKELAEELARALGGQVPRSLDAGPRISTGAPRRLSLEAQEAGTLAAGAATDAGLVRSSRGGRSSQMMFGAALVLLLGVVAYAGSRALKKDTPTAIVIPERLDSAPPVVPSVLPAPPPPPAASVLAEPTPLASAAPVVPVRAGRGRAHGPGAARVPSALPSAVAAPSLPSTAEPPRPESSAGRDIY